MRARLFLACAAAASLSSAGLFAQTTTAGAARDATSRVTVSGCVERADQMAGNTATTTVDSLMFVLVQPKPEAATGTAGTAGTTGATAPEAGASSSPRMYRLDGKLEELNLHVGQKVEVSGTVADPPTAPAGASSSTGAPRLKVESVKMLAPTCPR